MQLNDVSLDFNDIKALIPFMTEDEQAEIDELISGQVWLPLQGPQTEAYLSQADELFYGGSAGGGKTDLLIGCALTQHYRSIIFRRAAPQLQGILDRLHTEILMSRDGYNGQDKIQKLSGGRQLEFGSCPNIGDEQKYQGRPHDGLFFDEITHFMYSQYRFLCGWRRITRPGYRQRIIATGNPPTDSDGEWVIKHWAPWLDSLHPNPAKPGELRWYAVLDGIDTEVEDGTPFLHNNELITPTSRTFIPSKVTDNPYLMETGYKSQLQALPEPLRSQMLNGDFTAGLGDDPWQVIPTKWVVEAQNRWSPEGRDARMDSIGIDVARGGPDKTILARRHGPWFDELLAYPGAETPDGPTVAGLVVPIMRDNCILNVDVIGVGTSVYDHLKGLENMIVIAVNSAEKKDTLDRTSKLKFRNVRAEIWWRMRESLDPQYNENISLHPDPELKADLCAPRWSLGPNGILIEDKEALIKRIGRSTDKGDATCLTNYCPKNVLSPIDLSRVGE